MTLTGPTKTSDLTNDSGFISTETDPVFGASAAAGITSTNITSWNNKQEPLVSGTNIKTINNTSLLGNGNIDIQSTAQNVWYGTCTTGATITTKVVTTASGDFGGNVGNVLVVMFDNGLESAANIDYLVIDGTYYYVDAPLSFNQASAFGTPTTGTFVVTDNSDSDRYVSMIDNYIGMYVEDLDYSKQDILVSGTNIKTINNQSILGSGNISVTSSGTSVPTVNKIAQFDSTAHMNSTDMTSQEVSDFVGNLGYTFNLIDVFYPVGSYYETSDASFDPNITWGGTWSKVTEGYFLQATETAADVGTIVSAGLPNITGYVIQRSTNYNASNITWTGGGALAVSSDGTGTADALSQANGAVARKRIDFDASNSNSIYGNSTTVQPPAILVYIWHRLPDPQPSGEGVFYLENSYSGDTSTFHFSIPMTWREWMPSSYNTDGSKFRITTEGQYNYEFVRYENIAILNPAQDDYVVPDDALENGATYYLE